MNIKVIVANHKPGMIINDGFYLPVQVGKKLSSTDLGIQGDNEGDNISELNPVLCEMTGVYWAWKNLSADYIGLCHYRRYFTLKNVNRAISKRMNYWYTRFMGNLFHPGKYTLSAYKSQITTFSEQDLKTHAIEFENQISCVLNNNTVDAIIPRPYKFPCASIRQFFDILGREHVNSLCSIVKERDSILYKYLEKTLDGNELFAANMFIFKASIFEDYCQMVFPLLLQHIDNAQKSGWCVSPLKEKCYSRITGYMAEILTSAYILMIIKEKKQVEYVNTVFYSA